MDADLDGARLWWIASGLLLALELFSGTVFLLLLAIGLACAGLVAWGGGAVTLQMLTAALIGGGAMLALRTWRRRPRGDAPPHIGLVLDRGQAVHVSRWRADGTASVQYRGAHWVVRCTDDTPAAQAQSTGEFTIVDVEGTMLRVRPAIPATPSTPRSP